MLMTRREWLDAVDLIINNRAKQGHTYSFAALVSFDWDKCRDAGMAPVAAFNEFLLALEHSDLGGELSHVGPLNVNYCSPSSLHASVWGSGAQSFDSNDDFNRWLEQSLRDGPVLLTSIKRR